MQPLANVNAFRATRPVHERHAPTLAETQLLLQTIRNENGYPTNLIARLLYGCGLRVGEPLNLRIKDVDVQGHRLCIRGAKGGNDRVVPLPLSLAREIVQQMQSARVVWKQDKQNGTPLMLPHGLARQYPEYQFSWGWAWLFPGHHPCRDPRTGAIVRYRMHEVNVQRPVKHALRLSADRQSSRPRSVLGLAKSLASPFPRRVQAMSKPDPNTIRQAAAAFPVKQPARFENLQPWRDVIGELRAKGASFHTIAEFLNQYGIGTCKSIIASFCRDVITVIFTAEHPGTFAVCRYVTATMLKRASLTGSPMIKSVSGGNKGCRR